MKYRCFNKCKNRNPLQHILIVCELKIETKVVNVQRCTFYFYTFVKDTAQPSKTVIFSQKSNNILIFSYMSSLPIMLINFSNPKHCCQ